VDNGRWVEEESRSNLPDGLELININLKMVERIKKRR